MATTSVPVGLQALLCFLVDRFPLLLLLLLVLCVCAYSSDYSPLQLALALCCLMGAPQMLVDSFAVQGTLLASHTGKGATDKRKTVRCIITRTSDHLLFSPRYQSLEAAFATATATESASQSHGR